MNDLFMIACGTGFRDGLNPCIFMTGAILIASGRWLASMSLPVGCLRIIFVLAYILGALAFNFGPPQVFVLQNNFILTAKILYLVLGIWAFVSGVSYLKDWVSIRRGLTPQEPAGRQIKLFSNVGMTVCLVMAVLGGALSAMATLWPVDKYIIILGNAEIMKGQWQLVMPVLFCYVIVSMWALWFVWAFLAIKNLRPSLLKIFCVSIFLTASSCVILIFK